MFLGQATAHHLLDAYGPLRFSFQAGEDWGEYTVY